MLDQLLGLKRLTTGAADVALRFAHPLPAWAWAAALAALAFVAGWTYWRQLGPRWARASLGTLRWLLASLVLVLLTGPHLARQSERVEPDWVVVLADRSASLAVADAPGPDGVPRPREAQLREALERAAPTLSRLAATRRLLYLGFDAGAYELAGTPDAGFPDLASPAGRRTLLGQSLDDALRRVAGRPVAGLVVLSDGRSGDTPSRAVLRQLESRQIPVFAVPLGSPTPVPDLVLVRAESASAAFVGDVVPVAARLELRGGEVWPTGLVRLVDEATGLTLDERPLPTSDDEARAITLLARPDRPGEARWSLRIITDSPDLTRDNNALPIRLELADRPIRVVLADGYPRWEYQYLKNLLLREPSVRSAAMLLASDRRYIQEGSEPLSSLPRTNKDWSDIDVMILGDVRPGLLSEEQQRQIRWLVAERGAGLLWIGGPSATPAAWRTTPLADLLPFALADAERGVLPWTQPVLMTPGPAAERYGVLRLGEVGSPPWPADLSDADLGWNKFYWAQRPEPSTVKPAAETIALASPAGGSSSGGAPLVLTMRYGAGRVVYVGTDETWRYRYGRGEVLQERFWIPIIRLLARESLSRTGKRAILAASPERAQAEQPVLVTLRLVDDALAQSRPPSIAVRLSRAGTPATTELSLRPEPPAEEGAAPVVFSTSWTPSDPGRYDLSPADALLEGLDLAARVDVFLTDDELRTPQTDHTALAQLAAATGGRVIAPADLSTLPDVLPNRELRLLGSPEIETLWDKPIAWVLLISLLTLEWVGRRLIKLS